MGATIAWVLITWAVAIDGLPTLPVTVELKASFTVCHIDKLKAQKEHGIRAVCRPLSVLK